MLYIGGHAFNSHTTASELLSMGKYRATKLTPVMILTSEPYFVDFQGGLFTVDVAFANGALLLGMLTPYTTGPASGLNDWNEYARLLKSIGMQVQAHDESFLQLRGDGTSIVCQRTATGIRILFNFSNYI